MKPNDLVQKYGKSRYKIAKILKMKKSRVYNWFYRDQIPYDTQCVIEVITGGELKAEEEPGKTHEDLKE